MSTSRTQISTARLLAVAAVLIGVVFSLVPGLATPAAWAGQGCDDMITYKGNGDVQRQIDRVLLDLDGPFDVDTDAADVTCAMDGNVLRLFYDGDAVEVVDTGLVDAPGFHTSCSVDYAGKLVSIGGQQYTVLEDYWAYAVAPGNSDNCTPFPGTPAVASLSVDACEFVQSSAYPVTYSLAVNDGTTPFSLWADGAEVDADLDEGSGLAVGDFAPGTLLEIRDGDGAVVASATVPDGTCEPEVDPVASLSVGECSFIEGSSYPATYSLTVNDGDAPFSLWIDGVEGVALSEGTDLALGDFAPGAALEIKDAEGVVWASATVPAATCEPDVDPVASLSVGACAFDGEVSEYPATYSLTVNDGATPFALWVDGAAGTSLSEGSDVALGDFAPGTALEIKDAEGVVWASATVADGTCPPPPEPNSIDISLDKVVLDVGDVDEIGNFNAALGDSNVDDGLIVWSGEEILGGAVQTVTYRFTITNTGDDTLYNIVLDDPMLGGVLASGLTLAPGDSTFVDKDFAVAADDAFIVFEDGSVTPLAIDNTATVEATDETEELTASDEDIARVVSEGVFPEEPQELAIALVKEVIEGGDVAEIGDFDNDGDSDDGTIRWEEDEVDSGDTKTVVYRFTITNTGNVTLYAIELADPMISDSLLVSADEGLSLAPGKSMTIERSYELPATDAWPDGTDGAVEAVDNTATAKGSNEGRNATVSATDGARVVGTLVFDEVIAVAGLTNGALLPISVLLMALGAAILWLDRRRVAVR